MIPGGSIPFRNLACWVVNAVVLCCIYRLFNIQQIYHGLYAYNYSQFFTFWLSSLPGNRVFHIIFHICDETSRQLYPDPGNLDPEAVLVMFASGSTSRIMRYIRRVITAFLLHWRYITFILADVFLQVHWSCGFRFNRSAGIYAVA